MGRIESQIRQLDRRNGFEEEIVEENVVFWELQEYCIINGLNAPLSFNFLKFMGLMIKVWFCIYKIYKIKYSS